MPEIPELTFRGALGVLGQYDRPVLEQLNTALGGAVMIGGAVALAGVTAAPLVGLAAAWGWVDQKNEALTLVRKLLDRVSDRRSAARGYDRTRLIAAAHTVLVASSAVEAFRNAVGPKRFKDLEITKEELSALLAETSDSSPRTPDVLYDLAVPVPSAGRSFAENVTGVLIWQQKFIQALLSFCRGLRLGEVVRHITVENVAEEALKQYNDQYRLMAAQVPEFLVWTLLNESDATRQRLALAHSEVKAALYDHSLAMTRLESLLTAVSGRMPGQPSVLLRAARAELEQPVMPRTSAMNVLGDLRFPLVKEIFVQPHYRCEQVGARSRVADEQWWRVQP